MFYHNIDKGIQCPASTKSHGLVYSLKKIYQFLSWINSSLGKIFESCLHAAPAARFKQLPSQIFNVQGEVEMRLTWKKDRPKAALAFD